MLIGIESLSLASAVLAILLVRDITNRQERAHELLISGALPGGSQAV